MSMTVYRFALLAVGAVYAVFGVRLGVKWGRRAYKALRLRRCRRAGHTIMQLDVGDWQPDGGVANVEAHRQCVTCDGTRLAVAARRGPWGVRVQLEHGGDAGQWGWRLAGEDHRAAAAVPANSYARSIVTASDAGHVTLWAERPSGPERYVEEARRADDAAAARAYAELGVDRHAESFSDQVVDFEHDEATRAMEEIDRIIAAASRESLPWSKPDADPLSDISEARRRMEEQS